VPAQRRDDLVGVPLTVEALAEVHALDELGRDSGVARDVERTAFPVGDHHCDRDPAFQHRPEDGSSPRGEHADLHSSHPSEREAPFPSEIRRIRMCACFTLPDESGGSVGNKSPTPSEWTILGAGAVMLVASFLDFQRFVLLGTSTNVWGTY